MRHDLGSRPLRGAWQVGRHVLHDLRGSPGDIVCVDLPRGRSVWKLALARSRETTTRSEHGWERTGRALFCGAGGCPHRSGVRGRNSDRGGHLNAASIVGPLPRSKAAEG